MILFKMFEETERNVRIKLNCNSAFNVFSSKKKVHILIMFMIYFISKFSLFFFAYFDLVAIIFRPIVYTDYLL